MSRAAASLDRLASACFAALGPASRWGNIASANAAALRRKVDPVPVDWSRWRANDWRDFARVTDPDLGLLAALAAEEMAPALLLGAGG